MKNDSNKENSKKMKQNTKVNNNNKSNHKSDKHNHIRNTKDDQKIFIVLTVRKVHNNKQTNNKY